MLWKQQFPVGLSYCVSERHEDESKENTADNFNIVALPADGRADYVCDISERNLS